MNSQANFKIYILNLLFTIILLASLAGCNKPSEETVHNVSESNSRPTTMTMTDKPIELSASSEKLKSYSGTYVRKTFWDHLPEVRNWNEAKHKYNLHEVSAVLIEKDGSIMINAGWHEGYPPSSYEFREDGLWVKDSSSQWTGPFFRVGEPRQDEKIFFNRIFGESCYTSNTGEHWCFHSESIEMDGKIHKAELIPDSSEMPTYGTPVSIDGDRKSFLMFVPTNTGWKIFKDTYVSGDEYVETDPLTAKPFAELTSTK